MNEGAEPAHLSLACSADRDAHEATTTTTILSDKVWNSHSVVLIPVEATIIAFNEAGEKA